MKVNPFPGVIARKSKKIVLTPEQEDWLRTYYPMMGNARLVKLMGISIFPLYRFAQELGLKKSEKYLSAVWKRRAQKAKRTCEKNGFYDSLRGKGCPDACRQAVKKMWQDVREGKRESPFSKMKRENPKKYRAWKKNMSTSRAELIRQEQLRLKYGMKRKTNLTMIISQPYTRKQHVHRHSALLRGYLLAEDCSEQGGERWNIYYDDQTQRSERFEQNLIKDGFHVLCDA